MPPEPSDMKAPLPIADMGSADMPAPRVDMSVVDMPVDGDMSQSCVPQSDEEFCAAQGSVCGVTVSADNCGSEREVDCGMCADGSCVDGDCVDCPAPMCAEESDQCGVMTSACGAATYCVCDGTRLCSDGLCEKAELFPVVALMPSHHFGADVAVHDGVVVAGAPGGGGAAYVFERMSGAWRYTHELTPEKSGEFGARVEVTDRFIFVADPAFDAPAEDGQLVPGSGAVFAYLKSPANGEWLLAERITPPTRMITEGMRFGTSLSSDGQTLLVGAVAADGTGHVFSFTTVSTGVTWVFERELTSSVGARDRFGAAVAVDGDHAVVGAPSDGVTSHGRVVAFHRDGVWGEESVLHHKMMMPDGFGSSVALDRNSLGVGSPAANGGEGRVSLFTLNQQLGWGNRFNVNASNRSTRDLVGFDVALGRDGLLVTAPGREVRGDAEAGFVLSFVLDRADRMWEPGETYTALPEQSQDRFGQSIDRDGNLVVVGVPGRDTRVGPDTGAIYLFEAP